MQLECCQVVLCYGFEGAPYVRYSGCSGVRVVRAVVRSDVSIAFNEICVVVVLTKNIVRCLISSVKLSSESQTICALLVKVRTVVALCEVGL